MKLSVIISTHAREIQLNRLVAALAPQLLRCGGELLIADNGTRTPVRIGNPAAVAVHLHETEAGKCRVQNRALRRAAGDILVFLDDDLLTAPTYLDAVAHFFAEYPQFVAMKGRILPVENPSARVGNLAPYLDLPLVDHGEEVVEVTGVVGANMAFRRAVFDEVGPFDERLGPGACGHEEETEMSARLRRAGFKIAYAPGAIVYHDVDPVRADRARFLQIAYERGRCRVLHEDHSLVHSVACVLLAVFRVAVFRALRAGSERIAREEKRLATMRGLLAGVRSERANH